MSSKQPKIRAAQMRIICHMPQKLRGWDLVPLPALPVGKPQWQPQQEPFSVAVTHVNIRFKIWAKVKWVTAKANDRGREMSQDRGGGHDTLVHRLQLKQIVIK